MKYDLRSCELVRGMVRRDEQGRQDGCQTVELESRLVVVSAYLNDEEEARYVHVRSSFGFQCNLRFVLGFLWCP